eukprot:gnl/TRDRNA2_/TRDRNA2_184620_c0_seq1.p1 gnl/TRDRNA2_/TRDRNA2_184620_c0~~gnl/TRDRNA2_/TRDRNA2_184620_c0_seq1.p1  ORF type:complete len:334 (+),score=60.72 gnl/TRDRNA2_/TRDRNA2_184620_c0_seq1:64-1065(+)
MKLFRLIYRGIKSVVLNRRQAFENSRFGARRRRAREAAEAAEDSAFPEYEDQPYADDEEDEAEGDGEESEDEDEGGGAVEYYHPMGLADWEDPLYEEDFQELDKCLAAVQPKFVASLKHDIEADLDAAAEALLRPSRKFNALFVMGDRGQTLRREGAKYVPRIIPRVIVMTGHQGFGGNMRVNGIYERVDGDFHGRPVYRKTLEVVKEADWGDTGTSWADTLSEDAWNEPEEVWDPWMPRGPDQTRVTISRPRKSTTPAKVDRVMDPWFLYFDDIQGRWCVGPEPGGDLIYARHSGVDVTEELPDGLKCWEVWDVGRKVWHEYKGLQTCRGGQ